MNIAGAYTPVIGAYPNTEANIDTPLLAGRILGIGIALNGAASLDVVITQKATNTMPEQDILTATVSADGWFYPQRPAHAIADGAAIADIYGEGVPVCGVCNIAITGGATESADVVFLLE